MSDIIKYESELKDEEKYWRDSIKNNRYLLEEFRESLDKNELRQAILDNVELDLREEAVNMNYLKDLCDKWKDNIFSSFFESKYLESQNKYKKIYIKYGMLKIDPDKENKNKLSELELDNIRGIPIENLIEGAVEIKNAGGGRKSCCCPFHKDKTPSFIIYPDNSFHCFGCGKNGQNAIDFIMIRDNCDFYHALKRLS